MLSIAILSHLLVKNFMEQDVELIYPQLGFQTTFDSLSKYNQIKLRRGVGQFIILYNRHFTAIHISKGVLTYFNSIGSDNTTSNPIVCDLLKRYNLTLNDKSFRIQAKSSSLCGLYCIAFLKKRDINEYNKQALTEFFHMFNFDKLEKNDAIVKKYLKITPTIFKFMSKNK